MKATVLYDSKTGHTKQMAEIIAQGMEEVQGVQARSFPLEEVDEDWAKESRCVILGSPIYMASISARVKACWKAPVKNTNLPGN